LLKNRERLLCDRIIELNKYQGREITIENFNKKRLLARIYGAGLRVYILAIAGMGIDWGRQEVDEFFDSFEITSPTR
jgi:hypothetical protein